MSDTARRAAEDCIGGYLMLMDTLGSSFVSKETREYDLDTATEIIQRAIDADRIAAMESVREACAPEVCEMCRLEGDRPKLFVERDCGTRIESWKHKDDSYCDAQDIWDIDLATLDGEREAGG